MKRKLKELPPGSTLFDVGEARRRKYTTRSRNAITLLQSGVLDRLEELAARKGMTFGELWQTIPSAYRHVNASLSGFRKGRSIISMAELAQLARVHKVSVDALLGLPPAGSPSPKRSDEIAAAAVIRAAMDAAASLSTAVKNLSEERHAALRSLCNAKGTACAS